MSFSKLIEQLLWVISISSQRGERREYSYFDEFSQAVISCPRLFSSLFIHLSSTPPPPVVPLPLGTTERSRTRLHFNGAEIPFFYVFFFLSILAVEVSLGRQSLFMIFCFTLRMIITLYKTIPKYTAQPQMLQCLICMLRWNLDRQCDHFFFREPCDLPSNVLASIHYISIIGTVTYYNCNNQKRLSLFCPIIVLPEGASWEKKHAETFCCRSWPDEQGIQLVSEPQF